jgi:hypothetical protein
VPDPKFTPPRDDHDANQAVAVNSEGTETADDVSSMSSPEPIPVTTSSQFMKPVANKPIASSSSGNREEGTHNPVFQQVDDDFQIMLNRRASLIGSLVKKRVFDYADFDQFGFYDYLSMRNTSKQHLLTRFLNRHSLSLSYLISLARLFIRGRFDEELQYLEKEDQLQALAEYLVNVFLNEKSQAES